MIGCYQLTVSVLYERLGVSVKDGKSIRKEVKIFTESKTWDICVAALNLKVFQLTFYV